LATELLKCLPSELANPTKKPQVAVQLTTDATVLEENYQLTPTVLGHWLVDLLRVATAPTVPVVTVMSSLIVILDQAPLTWLESLEKYSIDKWDELKEQFTSNFVGVVGRSGTRMDLEMVKQEQGETLHKYMRRFFNKRATVVDVTDKEVIDLFQDGLQHRRTFKDFGRRRPSSITHLKDMITS
jgi:hypothetical protein